MKFALQFLILSVFISSANGQNFYKYSPISDSLARVHGIAELSINEAQIYRKKPHTYRKVYHYDSKGNNTYYCSLDDSLKISKILFSTIFTYTTEKEFGSANYYSFSLFHRTKIIEYDDMGRLLAWHFFKKNGKRTGTYKYIYRESLKEKLEYYNKKQKLSHYYTYDYWPNKKVKHTGLYNSKGKLIKYWDYSCDDEGKTITRIKDTLKICTYKAYLADGSTVTTTNSFNYRGDPVKYMDYRDTDSNQIKYLIYTGKSEILTYKLLQEYTNGKLSMMYRWFGSNKGKPYSSSTFIYDRNGKILNETDSGFYSKKPTVKFYLYTYNEAGLTLSKKGYKNGKEVYSANYRYRYYKKD